MGEAPSIGILDIAVERRLADRLGQRVARLVEGVADRIARAPGEAGDAALQRALAVVEADLAEALGADHRAHRFRPADRAHQLVVGGVVAGRDRLVHQLRQRGGVSAVLADQRGDRLVEQRQVAACQRDPVVEPDPAAVDRVERGDRHPQFADALLREQVVFPPAGRPAVVDRLDRDSDAAVERPGRASRPGRIDIAGRPARGG